MHDNDTHMKVEEGPSTFWENRHSNVLQGLEPTIPVWTGEGEEKDDPIWQKFTTLVTNDSKRRWQKIPNSKEKCQKWLWRIAYMQLETAMVH